MNRVITVNMVLSGRNTVAQAAELAGFARMTVNEWARTVDRDGFEALKRQEAQLAASLDCQQSSVRSFALSCSQPPIHSATMCGMALRFPHI